VRFGFASINRADHGSNGMIVVSESRYMATTENTGGSRVATVVQVEPASPEPKRSPEVAPK
jgi:hypothetical protein